MFNLIKYLLIGKPDNRVAQSVKLRSAVFVMFNDFRIKVNSAIHINTAFYGYKNHIKADARKKLFEEYIVTDASIHDSQATEQLLT
ncbi:MAG: transposase [Bacteroidota bacterium]